MSKQPKAWEIELAQWQQSKSRVKDETLHPIVKGDQEYWDKLDARQRRYSKGGTHARLKEAAARQAKKK